MRFLYCSNGCGRRIPAEAVVSIDTIKEVEMIKLECPLCNDVTEHVENLTAQITFKCSGCGKTKEANANPTLEQSVTTHHCPNCGRETQWRETGWTEIDIE